MKTPVTVALHGFGRVARALARLLVNDREIVISSVYDRATPATLAHLLLFDSCHGRLEADVSATADAILAGGRRIEVYAPEDAKTPQKADVAVVSGEAATAFRRENSASPGKRVIVAAPWEAADFTVIPGVNQEGFDPARHLTISASSPAAGCIAPVVSVLHGEFGVSRGFFTTIRPYGEGLSLLDHPHGDLRLARSAPLSIIPAPSTTAAEVAAVLPELAGRLGGTTVMVPTPEVSLAEMTLFLSKKTDAAAVNRVLKSASEGKLRGILGYSDEPLVSADYRGSPYSAVVDGLQTILSGGDLVRISAWYDNERGYAHRLADLMRQIA